MARKIILDIDPGIDDALALCLSLFDPNWEIVAVTAVGGNVSPAVATRNTQALVAYFDPGRSPRIGAASEPDHGLPVQGRFADSADDLRVAALPVAELRTPHPSEKVIVDEVRSAPHAVTVVALGPLTNLARAIQRDPEFSALVGRIVIAGGAVQTGGNITPAAEFNIFCDPLAARVVFSSAAPKTLIPLDASNKLALGLGFLNELPEETNKVGMLFRKLLSAKFRNYRLELGRETIHLHDTLALMAVACPELFRFVEMSGDVETAGELTMGATVFDRRAAPAWRHNNLEVAVSVDAGAIHQEIVRRLRQAADSVGDVSANL